MKLGMTLWNLLPLKPKPCSPVHSALCISPTMVTTGQG
jgi:hypothetical protein